MDLSFRKGDERWSKRRMCADQVAELEQYATASRVADNDTSEPTASMSLQRRDAATRPTAEDASKKQADLFRSLLTSAARSSISTLQQGLARMTTYWSGISWIAGALDQRAAGIPTNDIDLVAVQEQLAPYISQPETVFAASPANPATQQRLAGQTPRVETVQQGLTDGSFDFGGSREGRFVTSIGLRRDWWLMPRSRFRLLQPTVRPRRLGYRYGGAEYGRVPIGIAWTSARSPGEGSGGDLSASCGHALR
jgi:hypothetical protein